MIGRVAAKHGVPDWLVRNVVKAESGGNPIARSPVGAMGLMQLMPGTAAELGVSDPFNPAENLDGGTRYLRQMLDRFDGDVAKAVAAYNAGPGAVEKHGGIPPYAETQAYVKRVLD
jgi:soluble lytic murein transglycosylase-like protein